MRLFVLGMLLTFSEARRRFSSDKEWFFREIKNQKRNKIRITKSGNEQVSGRRE